VNALRNPALGGFYPDPSICRVGDDYYLACSSFEYLPGVPVFHSTDLENWALIGHVVDRPEQLALTDVPTLGGAWAPTIRCHDGAFHVVITDAMGRGSLIFTADDPAGPWSDGIVMQGVSGIDPDVAWDADGTAYITYSGLQLDGPDLGAHLGIQQVRMDLSTGVALEKPRSLWSGTGLKFPEAPHLYEIEGDWYLMIAEGGTERGHGVSIARGPAPWGPFQGCPGNPVFSARSTSWPVQNAGHGDLVRTPDGGWAMVLLGMRARGMTQAFSPMGRETFITGLEWVDGWPVMEPLDVISGSEPLVVEGIGGPEWISIRTPAPDWSEAVGDELVIDGDGSTMDDPRPRFVGRRQQHAAVVFAARVDPGDGVGGLTLRIDENHHYDVEVGGGIARARGRIGPFRQTWDAPVAPGPVTLRIETRPTAGVEGLAVAPDVVHLFDGDVELAALDGRYLSAETAAAFTGRVVGMYAVSGAPAFDEVRYEGRDETVVPAPGDAAMTGGAR
jgi:xylan 1,4-beta-xylosidase